MPPRRLLLIVILGLILTTVAVFWPVVHHDFVDFDDNYYVTGNPHVQAGLTWQGIVWAFTTTYAWNWHPMTWLSHMLDYQIYGAFPAGHHLTNLLLHSLNAALLFLLLERMTGALWSSVVVALLFAVHPLHVESVAWVSERKDVLSALFWILAMGAYVRYTKSPRACRYLTVLFLFVLGLMTKPMVVTLPFVLLLVDYWPLGRLKWPQSATGSRRSPEGLLSISRSVGEKVPLFALSAVSCVITFIAQQAKEVLDTYPLQIRIANALTAYMTYVARTVWPQDLCVLYPHQGSALPFWQAWVAAMVILSVSAAAVRAATRHGYLFVGWFWFVGTLVPVIGIVQVGEQSTADRYTYLPLIGIFLVLAWGVPDLLKAWPRRRALLVTAPAIWIGALTLCTRAQIGHWENTTALYERALQVTSQNYAMHENYGLALMRHGRFEEAIGHFSKALEIRPQSAKMHNEIGIALVRQGNVQEAIARYARALAITPDFPEAHFNMGAALLRQEAPEEAIHHFSRALQLKPDLAEAHHSIAIAYYKTGDHRAAIAHVDKAAALGAAIDSRFLQLLKPYR